MALPDINVLLALAWSNHPHHDAAHRWFARDAAAGYERAKILERM